MTPEAVADALERLYADRDLLRTMSIAAYRVATRPGLSLGDHCVPLARPAPGRPSTVRGATPGFQSSKLFFLKRNTSTAGALSAIKPGRGRARIR